LIRYQVILVIPLGWWMVGNPLFLDPSDGVFGRFDLADLLRLPHLKYLFVSLFVCLSIHLRLECLACTTYSSSPLEIATPAKLVCLVVMTELMSIYF